MNCTVSVIIPVYNGADFIARAVDSALAQSHRPHEVIVVDDGSRDATRQVLAPFGQRIRLLCIPNGGVAHARNVGMQAASGDLIAFLDADDVWRPNKLALQLAALRAHPHVGFCCCDFHVYSPRARALARHFSLCKGAAELVFDQPLCAPFPILVKVNFVGTASNVLITRALMQKVGLFNTAYRQAEDYEYWLRCAQFTHFILLSPVLLEKTTHESNLTNNSLETFLCHEQVLLALETKHAQAIARGACLPAALARIRYEIAHQFFIRGATGRALRYYVAGLRSDWSLANALTFTYLLGRKLLRFASMGLLRSRATAQAKSS
ncbi:MAG: glycosyltransferase family A protein [Pseudomonadota bacterium]